MGMEIISELESNYKMEEILNPRGKNVSFTQFFDKAFFVPIAAISAIMKFLTMLVRSSMFEYFFTCSFDHYNQQLLKKFEELVLINCEHWNFLQATQATSNPTPKLGPETSGNQ
ncbi:MAG: hypothetical protein IPJ23_00945 [Ignavibacteriales bacterium]|nr:hypothetical protein [Ignavibacteriales bacterium]